MLQRKDSVAWRACPHHLLENLIFPSPPACCLNKYPFASLSFFLILTVFAVYVQNHTSMCVLDAFMATRSHIWVETETCFLVFFPFLVVAVSWSPALPLSDAPWCGVPCHHYADECVSVTASLGRGFCPLVSLPWWLCLPSVFSVMVTNRSSVWLSKDNITVEESTFKACHSDPLSVQSGDWRALTFLSSTSPV